MFQIRPIPILKSNYVWCLSHGNQAWVVDPGDHAPVVRFLKQHRLSLQAILITHHHWDHISGVQNLLWHFSDASIPVIGPRFDGASPVRQVVDDADTLDLQGHRVDVVATPGHTFDHISYWLPEQKALFCGDTLFSCGCGRVTDGSAKQLHQTLNTLDKLPPDTQVYCTHEYTLNNIRFAMQVEPDNSGLEQYRRRCTELRDQKQPTLPTTIGLEQQLNPFMRCSEPSIIDAASRYAKAPSTTPQEVFATLRRWKDTI